jgi:hypothetical protein
LDYSLVAVFFGETEMASGQRKHGESFKAYRARLKNEEYGTKHKMRGRLIWNSAKKGTYIRKIHGPLGS